MRDYGALTDSEGGGVQEARRHRAALPLVVLALLALSACRDGAERPAREQVGDTQQPVVATTAPETTPPERLPQDIHPSFVTLEDLERATGAPPLRMREGRGPYEDGGLPPQCTSAWQGGIEAGGSWRDVEHAMHYFFAAPAEPGWSVIANVSEFATLDGAREAFAGSRAVLAGCEGFREQGADWTPESFTDVDAADDAFAFVGTSEQSYPPGRLSELGPARVCWAYARVGARVTAIGVHAAQRDLSAAGCTRLAEAAAQRLQATAEPSDS